MNWPPKKRLQSVVGITIVGGQLRAAQVARAKAAVAVLRSASAPLALDLLHPEPELVGRELRNHLDSAHIRERHCVVALPDSWVMSHHVSVPELGPEDTASLLQIEAEKNFPCAPEELQISRSEQRAAAARFVTQLAVRQEQIVQLGEVLKSAGLKPVSYTLGLTALPGALGTAGRGGMMLLVEPKGAVLLVAAGGGVAAFRTFEATIESEFGEHVVNGPALARELRITFEQLPAELRTEVKELALRGDVGLTTQLGGILQDWARDAGLVISLDNAGGKPAVEEIPEQLGMRFLKDGPPALEFLPPRPSRWSQLMMRYNSRRLASVGVAAAAATIVGIALFGWQEFRLWSLRTQWDGMAAQVKDLEAVQARIREFRPWYDTSFRNLTIMRRVVECFPDNGSLTAKTFEIHNQNNVSITGTTRDNAALLRTHDLLRQVKEIKGLKIEQIRGKTPAQFTFTFRWGGTTGT